MTDCSKDLAKFSKVTKVPKKYLNLCLTRDNKIPKTRAQHEDVWWSHCGHWYLLPI